MYNQGRTCIFAFILTTNQIFVRALVSPSILFSLLKRNIHRFMDYPTDKNLKILFDCEKNLITRKELRRIFMFIEIDFLIEIIVF